MCSLSLFCWQKYRKRENLKIFKPPPADRSPLFWAAPQTRHAQSYTKMCSGSIWRKKSSFLASYGSQTLYSDIKVAFIPSVYPVPPCRVFFHFCFLNTTQLISSEKTCDSPKLPLAGWFFKAWKWNLDEQVRWRSLVPFEMIWVPIG